MKTVREVIDGTGWVPVRPKSPALRHRVLLHSMEPRAGLAAGSQIPILSVCGLYGAEAIMDEGDRVPEETRKCARCTFILRKREERKNNA